MDFLAVCRSVESCPCNLPTYYPGASSSSCATLVGADKFDPKTFRAPPTAHNERPGEEIFSQKPPGGTLGQSYSTYSLYTDLLHKFEICVCVCVFCCLLFVVLC